MKVFCCYTASHASLFENYFRPSLPADFDLQVRLLDDLTTSGAYLGVGYVECLCRKIRLIAESLRALPDELILWSDVDILFLKDTAAADLKHQMEASGSDLLFMREARTGPTVNGGFYVCRANARTVDFFEKVGAYLEVHPSTIDQDAINHLLPTGDSPLRWGHLSPAYYARTNGWPPPRDLMVYHANETTGADSLEQKRLQFKELDRIRRYGWPALAWSLLRKVPKRLRRWAGLKPKP